jgi:hypothetical protein
VAPENKASLVPEPTRKQQRPGPGFTVRELDQPEHRPKPIRPHLALVTGRIGSFLKLTGSYQRAHGEADTNETENANGSFVSFQISRLFAGLAETASTESKATFWTGGGRAEFSMLDGVDFSAGFTRRHRYLDGFALVSTLYLDTRTYSASDPPNLLVLCGQDRDGPPTPSSTRPCPSRTSARSPCGADTPIPNRTSP